MKESEKAKGQTFVNNRIHSDASLGDTLSHSYIKRNAIENRRFSTESIFNFIGNIQSCRHDLNIFAMTFSHSNATVCPIYFRFCSLAHSFIRNILTYTSTRSFCPNKINFSLEFAFSQFLCVMRKIPKPNHFFFIVAVLHACVWGWSTDSIVCIMVSILNFIFNFLGARLQTAREIQTYCIFYSGNKVIVRKICYTYSRRFVQTTLALCEYVKHV